MTTEKDESKSPKLQKMECYLRFLRAAKIERWKSILFGSATIACLINGNAYWGICGLIGFIIFANKTIWIEDMSALALKEFLKAEREENETNFDEEKGGL